MDITSTLRHATPEEEKLTNSSADICVLNETRLMAVSYGFVFFARITFLTLDKVLY